MSAPAPFPYERPMCDGIARIVSDTVGGPDALSRLSQLVDQAAAFAETVLKDVSSREPPPRPVACKKGCAFCCHGREVHVTSLEVLRIAGHIAENFPIDRIAALLTRTVEVEQEKREQWGEGPPRRNFRCPLLVDNVCSVYPVRPFVCRGFNSYDAYACELQKKFLKEDAKIEGYAHQGRAAQAALAGLRRGLEESGIGSEVLDLAPALRIVLTTPNVAPRWLSGEPVFDGARARLARDDERPTTADA